MAVTLEEWKALAPAEQLDRWLAVPDAMREKYVVASHPAARPCLECIPRFTGDTARDRLLVREALQKADWLEHGHALAELRDDTDRLTGFIERIRHAESAAINWEAGLNDALLEQWPASRLVSTVGRMRPGIKQRWIAAGGVVYSGGKLIAHKRSDVWVKFSRFGRPHPPYDWENEWLDVEDVEAETAQRLGITARAARSPAISAARQSPSQREEKQSVAALVFLVVAGVAVFGIFAALFAGSR